MAQQAQADLCVLLLSKGAKDELTLKAITTT